MDQATFNRLAVELSRAIRDDLMEELHERGVFDLRPTQLSGHRVPAGYTHERPLRIAGREYIGGEFVPGDVMAEASPDEKAKVTPEGTHDTDREPVPGRHEPIHDETNHEEPLPPVLAAKVKRAVAGAGREIRLDRHEVAQVLNAGIVGFISAGRNNNLPSDKLLSDADIAARHDRLRQRLVDKGLKFVPIHGKYGTDEDSYLVMVPDVERHEMQALGREFHQDSIIYSERGQNEMIFTTGPHTGRAFLGSGWSAVPEADDFFSEMVTADGERFKFQLAFNFDDMVALSRWIRHGVAFNARLGVQTMKPPTKADRLQRMVPRSATAPPAATGQPSSQPMPIASAPVAGQPAAQPQAQAATPAPQGAVPAPWGPPPGQAAHGTPPAQVAPAGQPDAGQPTPGSLPAGPSGLLEYPKTMPAHMFAGSDERQVKRLAQQYFGPKATMQDLALAAGAGPKDDVTFGVDPSNQEHPLQAHVKGPNDAYYMRTLFGQGPDGKPTHHLDLIQADPKKAPKSAGLDMIGRSAHFSKQLGVGQMDLDAAGNEGLADKKRPWDDRWTGYSYWPELGFDKSVEDIKDQEKDKRPWYKRWFSQDSQHGFKGEDKGLYQKVKQAFPQAKTIGDIVKTPAGRDWWRKNGGTLYGMHMNLADNSPHLKSLAAMQQKKMNELAALHAEGQGQQMSQAARGPHDLEPLPEGYDHWWERMPPHTQPQIGEDEWESYRSGGHDDGHKMSGHYENRGGWQNVWVDDDAPKAPTPPKAPEPAAPVAPAVAKPPEVKSPEPARSAAPATPAKKPDDDPDDEATRQAAAEEYKQLGTKSHHFKNWFGDWEHAPEKASKAVDKNGQPEHNFSNGSASVVSGDDGAPMIAYHGTPHGGFKEFDASKIADPEGERFGPAFYFTNNKDVATKYATGIKGVSSEDIARRKAEAAKGQGPEIKHVYLKVHHPFDADKVIDPAEAIRILKGEKSQGGWGPAYGEAGAQQVLTQSGYDMKHLTGQRFFELLSSLGGDYGQGRSGAKDILEKAGYDGITNIGEDKDRQWAVFQPHQVKAVENRGTFHPDHKRIDFARPNAAPSVAKIVQSNKPLPIATAPIQSKITAQPPQQQTAPAANIQAIRDRIAKASQPVWPPAQQQAGKAITQPPSMQLVAAQQVAAERQAQPPTQQPVANQAAPPAQPSGSAVRSNVAPGATKVAPGATDTFQMQPLEAQEPPVKMPPESPGWGRQDGSAAHWSPQRLNQVDVKQLAQKLYHQPGGRGGQKALDRINGEMHHWRQQGFDAAVERLPNGGIGVVVRNKSTSTPMHVAQHEDLRDAAFTPQKSDTQLVGQAVRGAGQAVGGAVKNFFTGQTGWQKKLDKMTRWSLDDGEALDLTVDLSIISAVDDFVSDKLHKGHAAYPVHGHDQERIADVPDQLPDDTVRHDSLYPQEDEKLPTELHGWRQDVPSHAARSLWDYTTHGGPRSYEAINGIFRQPGGLKPVSALSIDPKNPAGEAVKGIDEAFQHAKPLSRHVTVWRGAEMNANRAADFRQKLDDALEHGEAMGFKGLQSTSLTPSVAAGWKGLAPGRDHVMLEIRSRHGIYLGHHSQKPSEREFLLPHGSVFHVTGKKKLKFRGQDGKEEERDVYQLDHIDPASYGHAVPKAQFSVID